jgi:hypothetical protein
VKDFHIAIGILSIVLYAVAAGVGAFRYWRVEVSTWFWRFLRAGQAVVLVEVLDGGAWTLTGRHTSSLHVLYGVLPLLVSFIAEALRAASAEMVLGARGLEGAEDVRRLPPDEQQVVAISIVQRELGVMTLAAIVIIVLLARAAGTA